MLKLLLISFITSGLSVMLLFLIIMINEHEIRILIYIEFFIVTFSLFSLFIYFFNKKNSPLNHKNTVTIKESEIKILKANEKYRKEFIGNVSHELKTPIFNIQGFIYTLLDGGIDDDEINIRYLKNWSF